jgi:ANTAR domain
MGEPVFAARAASAGEPRRIEHALGEAAEWAVRGTRDSRGATAAVWFHAEPVAVSSHPALAEFVELQLRRGEGPLFMPPEEGVWVADTATDRRWPQLSVLAFAYGIRSMVVGHASVRGLRTTCGLYWPVPGAGRDGEEAALRKADAVARRLARTVGAIEDGIRMRRAVNQLSSALASRSAIDIAKGMIMQATGCDEDAAFAELVRVSQRSNVKLAEVAGRLVRSSATEG